MLVRSSLLLALGALFSLTSCKTIETGTVTGNRVVNRTVGFHGYQIDFPPGFVRMEESGLSPAELHLHDQKVARYKEAVKMRNLDGAVVRDFFAFVHPQRDILLLFGVEDLNIDYPIGILEKGDKDYLKRVIREDFDLQGSTGTWEDRDYSGSFALAFTGSYDHGGERLAISSVLVAGNLYEIYLLEGIGPVSEAAAVRNAVDTAARSLLVFEN